MDYFDYRLVDTLRKKLRTDKKIVITDTVARNVSSTDQSIVSYEIDEILKFIGNDEYIIVFNVKDEGLPYGTVEYSKKYIELVRMTNNKCKLAYYLTGAEATALTINTFYQENPGDIKLICLNNWESCLADDTFRRRDVIFDLSKKKKYDFLCFNGSPRYHRLLLIGLLSKYKVLDKGLVSYNHVERFKTDNILDEFHTEPDPPLDKRFNKIYFDIVNEFKNTLPNSKKIEDDVGKVVYGHWPHPDTVEFYERSRFIIITETGFGNKPFDEDIERVSLPSHFLTEKTYRTLSTGIPFVLQARAGSLKLLQSKGYKTFHPYINETYDTIEDDQERLIAIANEVKRLCSQSKKEWKQWHKDIQNIIDYNLSVMNNKKWNLELTFVD